MVLDESRPHRQEESLVEAIGSIRVGLRFLAPKSYFLTLRANVDFFFPTVTVME